MQACRAARATSASVAHLFAILAVEILGFLVDEPTVRGIATGVGDMLADPREHLVIVRCAPHRRVEGLGGHAPTLENAGIHRTRIDVVVYSAGSGSAAFVVPSPRADAARRLSLA